MKKKIYIVFNDKDKQYVSTTLYSNLKYVFRNYLQIETCFLDEIEPSDITDGDLFLVLYEDRVHKMRKYTSSLDRVVVMTRTVQKRFLKELFNLPAGTDILVVNDSDESTLQTTNTLYTLGLNHINLVPYTTDTRPNDISSISFAITPNENDLVPSSIRRVLNIGDRYLDVSTFIRIIARLELENEEISANLIRYTNMVAEPDRGSNFKYVQEHWKNDMLKSVVQDAREAVILTDKDFKIEYANRKATGIFNAPLLDYRSLSDLSGNDCPDLCSANDYTNKLFCIGGVNYLTAKTTLKYNQEAAGYAFILNHEQDIKNIGEDLSKNLSKSGLVAKYSFSDLLYISEEMDKCITLAKKVALTDYTVLIVGESGTGKELIAQSVHNYSQRRLHPFVAINCAALPESLLESELFGYEKGAFTGASKTGKAGLFEQANKGTIFLDEIGDMSLHLQSRLLRVLQEKQVMRLGSNKVVSVDIRIIAATNHNLIESIRNQNFREDLYYRLCNIPIIVPPLRNRYGDVLFLLRNFLGSNYDHLSSDEISAIKNYSWPGNVRELKNAADYYALLHELPSSLFSASAINIFCKSSVPSVETAVLEIIERHSQKKSGIGRTAILYELREMGISLSDNKLRNLLKDLEIRQKIVIGKGRSGCRIPSEN